MAREGEGIPTGWVNRRKLAKTLGIHESTTRAWERRDDFPRELRAHHRRGRPFWTPDQVERWIEYRDAVDD